MLSDLFDDSVDVVSIPVLCLFLISVFERERERERERELIITAEYMNVCEILTDGLSLSKTFVSTGSYIVFNDCLWCIYWVFYWKEWVTCVLEETFYSCVWWVDVWILQFLETTWFSASFEMKVYMYCSFHANTYVTAIHTRERERERESKCILIYLIF